MSMMYHFGVPGWLIWLFHIMLGIVMAYIGYEEMNDRRVDKNFYLGFFVLGVLAPIYHLHLWSVVRVRHH